MKAHESSDQRLTLVDKIERRGFFFWEKSIRQQGNLLCWGSADDSEVAERWVPGDSDKHPQGEKKQEAQHLPQLKTYHSVCAIVGELRFMQGKLESNPISYNIWGVSS